MPPFKGSPLGELLRLRQVRTRRASSGDGTGGNNDFVRIQPGESSVLAGARPSTLPPRSSRPLPSCELRTW